MGAVKNMKYSIKGQDSDLEDAIARLTFFIRGGSTEQNGILLRLKPEDTERAIQTRDSFRYRRKLVRARARAKAKTILGVPPE